MNSQSLGASREEKEGPVLGASAAVPGWLVAAPRLLCATRSRTGSGAPQGAWRQRVNASGDGPAAGSRADGRRQNGSD